MTTEIRTDTGQVLAVLITNGMEVALASCAHIDPATGFRCPVHIQRTSSGDLRDGVRAHYKAVHPERKIR